MKNTNNLTDFFVVVSVCREDLMTEFDLTDDQAEKVTDQEMINLAGTMSDILGVREIFSRVLRKAAALEITSIHLPEEE